MPQADSPFQTPSGEPVLSVAELTDRIKGVVEGAFPSVWVAGEISNFARPQSGHCYLTLKDDQAQIRAVIWRGVAGRVRFPLEDGLEVVCHGHLDVYAPRGSYQLVVEEILPKGVGALELALRRLRERLAAEGLFDEERKQPLPKFPQRIAMVTSPTGAAVHDFLQVIRRRWQAVEILIIPARVQGDGAADEIAEGIRTANRLATPIDVLVVGRGGGSLEDLWAFNEEAVVRAIAASRIPVVSAVGHEIDVTLSDLAADVRALTPSEAAELVVPSGEEIAARVRSCGQRLSVVLRTRAERARARLDDLAARRVFRRPADRVHELSRRVDEIAVRYHRAIRQRLTTARSTADAAAGKLETLSPLSVLGRGYSLTQRLDGRLVQNAADLTPGDQLKTRLAQGEVISRVEDVEGED